MQSHTRGGTARVSRGVALAMCAFLLAGATQARADDDTEHSTKALIDLGLSQVPVAGGFVGLMFDEFWAMTHLGRPVDYWAAVRDQVIKEIQWEIGQALDNKTFADKKAILDGLKAEASVYRAHPDRFENWHDLKSALLRDLPEFQEAGYELVLLPLYTQLVNLQLATMRDCVLFGGSAWQLSPAEVEDCYADPQTQQGLKDLVEKHVAYTYKTYQAGRDGLPTAAQALAYDGTMAYSVLDFADRWRYFDPRRYTAPPVPLVDTRELFAVPDGWPAANNFPASMLATGAPFNAADLSTAGKLTKIEVWRQGRDPRDLQTGVNRARATYGTTAAPQVGVTSAADFNHYLQDAVTISEQNPIVAVKTVRVTQDSNRWSVLSGLGFGFQDKTWAWRGRTSGTSTPSTAGTFNPKSKPSNSTAFASPTYSFPGNILSSIVLAGQFDDGVGNDKNAVINAGFGYLASTAMFGFRQPEAYDYLQPLVSDQAFSLRFDNQDALGSSLLFMAVTPVPVTATMGMGSLYKIRNAGYQELHVDNPADPSTVSWVRLGKGDPFLVRFVQKNAVRISYGTGDGYDGNQGKPQFYYGLVFDEVSHSARLVTGTGDTFQFDRDLSCRKRTGADMDPANCFAWCQKNAALECPGECDHCPCLRNPYDENDETATDLWCVQNSAKACPGEC